MDNTWVQTSDGRIWKIVYQRLGTRTLVITRHHVASMAMFNVLFRGTVRSLTPQDEASFFTLPEGSTIH